MCIMYISTHTMLSPRYIYKIYKMQLNTLLSLTYIYEISILGLNKHIWFMSFMSTKLILKSVNGEACFMSYMYLQNIYILDKWVFKMCIMYLCRHTMLSPRYIYKIVTYTRCVSCT